MDMLRHDDMGPEQELAALPRFAQCFDKPSAASILVQERQPLEARECKLVRLPRDVVGSITSPKGHAVSRCVIGWAGCSRLRMLSSEALESTYKNQEVKTPSSWAPEIA